MLNTLLKPACRATGRIGLEFDTNGIFCAQVRRSGIGWKLDQTRTFSATDEILSGLRQGTSFVPFKATELLQAAAGFRGSEVAGVLPMEACDLRVLELPAASQSELQLMVRNEVEGLIPANAVFDFWQLPAGMTTRNDLTGICSLSTDGKTIADAVRLIHDGGFTIAGIDGLPTACARAVSLMDAAEDSTESNVGSRLRMVVHIGWKRCLLVLVSDGIPVLARIPRADGLSSFLSVVGEEVSLTAHELLRLIRGIRDLPVQPTRRVRTRLDAAVRSWCMPVCEEVMRSISFARRPGLRMVPTSVIIMGSGGIISNLPEIMTEELNIDVRPWQLAAEDTVSHGPEYAVAAALSAWEIE